MNRRTKYTVPLLAVIGLLGGLLGAISSAPQVAHAAVGSKFDAGDIISDALFFDGAAMSATDVQSFLNSKVSTCRSGYTCLKDYRQSTTTKAAESGRCAAYIGAANESAAAIIAKVGSACGISQKALIVLLEKEQSLVTDDWPGAGQYRSATGYACPDTSGCDAAYYGFFNQVYSAALQFKRYAASPTAWNHIAGRVNNIRYNPNAACGTGAVFIQNQATAGLYNYTPYQPNAAALANLYGTGDGCSSYGNRNFWRLYTDWFGATTAGTSLVRTASNATVYLTSGTNKYPVPSLQLLNALAPLGPLGYVSQQYLDSYATQQNVGRILRSPDGTIYFYDSGIKLPFSSCGLVVDYGGKCDTSGFVQLTAEQLSQFATGPAMGPVLGTTAGSRYFITAGTKREILDSQSQAAAGIPAGYNVLTEDAVSSLPLGAPIIRDAVFTTQRGSANSFYLGNGLKYVVDPVVASGVGLPQRSVGSLNADSLAKITSGAAPFAAIVQVPGSTSKQILADGGRYEWAGATGTALTAVSVPQSFVDSYAVKGTLAVGSMIKTASSGTVYIVMDGKILPVGAWESLVALAGGKTPVIVTVPDQLIAALPKGPVALTSNTLVRSPDDATVYLIDGVTSKIALSNFAFATEAGITGFSYTTQARLDAYPRQKALLGFGLTCGATKYVSAGGSVHSVSSSLLAQFPFTYVTLDAYTCQLLKIGATATPFIRTPDGTIYFLGGGQKHAITSMARFNELSQGQAWLAVDTLFASGIPSGPQT
ncbi:hypothetical protein [Rathayibacter soli]|uniref:hypothetical protein n=1 Tax=Rathayibacter soli TaxID=3144168 RepID=UPI0027E4F579|nr:hypothetical protein [Glaciibacter superstes]